MIILFFSHREAVICCWGIARCAWLRCARITKCKSGALVRLNTGAFEPMTTFMRCVELRCVGVVADNVTLVRLMEESKIVSLDSYVKFAQVLTNLSKDTSEDR